MRIGTAVMAQGNHRFVLFMNFGLAISDLHGFKNSSSNVYISGDQVIGKREKGTRTVV